MPHDPFYVMVLPIAVRSVAQAMLARALENVDRCGESRSIERFSLESHTLGCRYEAGDADPWDVHWRIFDEYAADGVSFIMGDPGDGAFVTVTPPRDVRLDGAGYGLGQRREKARIPLERAERTADRVMKELAPLVKFALVAGSIRRRELEIGDVEVVVLPKDVRKFVEALKRMGFTEGGDRIRKGVRDGQKVEIYIAHHADELGAMVQMYTGDFIFNTALRTKALRAGYHLDQYGLFVYGKRGKRYVFQSPDEEDIFAKLKMEWHEPEQRSLGRRSELRKMGGEILSRKLTDSEESFVRGALDTLRTGKYVPLEDQASMEALYRKKVSGKTRLSGRGPFLGAEELIELGDTAEGVNLEDWQEAYERATGGQGKVVDVFANLDEESFRLWVMVDEPEAVVFYIPLFYEGPTPDEVVHYRDRPMEWVMEVAPQVFDMNLKWEGPFGEPT